jgi:LacI family transcriptional regulator
LTIKRVTSQEVADAAGVSRTTVSLVLNNVEGIQISEETRKRVIDAAQELDYVPDAAARALASRRAQIIGLLLTRSPHHIASDAFLTQILDGLINVIHCHNMRLLIDIIEPEHQKEAYLQLVRAKHIDGVILSGPRFDDQALRALEADGFPAVLMGQLPGTNLNSVDVDNRSAARQAVEHLVNLGHHQIACITNAPTLYTAAEERLSGYREALESNGLVYNEALVRHGDFSIGSGYQQMCDLVSSGAQFTAAFVASDEVALGAKAALRETGVRVPHDVALVGFDDLPMAYYTDPPLTTVHLPAVELAQQASELLLQLLKGRQVTKRKIILDTHLVVRNSCGAYLAKQ